jgi:hypothetical protein
VNCIAACWGWAVVPKGNRGFHVLYKKSGAWQRIGYLGGFKYEMEVADHEWAMITTTWYNGGGEYTRTNYVFDSGKYVEAGHEVGMPVAIK